ncbi:MAG: hypothetical protein SFU98_04030 [Leptospiraceae bacterium]|nr:hypothetical protein [Leptospiraceae bacterium]
MKTIDLLTLGLPYITYTFLSLVSNSWILFLPKEYIISISVVFAFLQFITLRYSFQLNMFYFSISIILLWTLGILFFPIQNLNLGDGVILLETLVLESKIFGYELILDEVLEGLIHSSFYSIINNKFPNPMFSFRILSTAAGFFLLTLIFWKNRKNLFPSLVIICSGGSILFFGYVENYTYVSLFLLLFQILGISYIQEEKKSLLGLLILTLVASIAILLHLLSGYLIFSLVYLCYILSAKENFWRNAFLSTILGLTILVSFVGYFFLFSELRFDLSLSHIANPKFYPMKRMISISHFMEIFYCLIFSSLPSISIIAYFYFSEKEVWKKVVYSSEGKFILWVLFGLVLHAFTFNPQLGFPSDWDLMSLYWTSFAMFAFILLKEKTEIFPKLLPVIIFSFIITVSNVFILNKEDPNKANELNFVLKTIDEFVPKYKTQIEKIHPKDRKFYLKTSFFLFKSRVILENQESSSENNSLKNENYELEKEFNSNFQNRTKDWNKNFLERATKFNIRFIEYSKNLK